MIIKIILAPKYMALYITSMILISAWVLQVYEYTMLAMPIAMMFIAVWLICSSIESLKDKE
jgi:hypothetical protein